MTIPQQQAQAAPPPGWYPDPASPAVVRWWSGGGWTEHTAPLGQGQPSAEGEDRWTAVNLVVPQASTLGVRALVWGIVAILLPVVVLPGILAIAFGAGGIGRSNDRRRRGLPDDGRGVSIAGVVLGGTALVLALVAYGVLFALISSS